MTIWTIGHSNRKWREFVEMLKVNLIHYVVDIRGLPGSTLFPHFNKERMIAELPLDGMEYVHIENLGGKRNSNPNSLNLACENESFRSYADYMETRFFRYGIATLLEFAEKGRVCCFCSEAVPWLCHRSMVCDYLLNEGIWIEHIMTIKKNQAHKYTRQSSIVDGKISYRE